jgi:circadian clock protein KaiC
VMKKRGGHHESTIREFTISNSGFVVGQPLKSFQGILRGVPEYVGRNDPLMERPT